MTTIDAIYRNGVFEPTRRVELPEECRVRLQVEPVDPGETLDVGARLDELRALKDGWLEGRGRAPAAEGMDWLAGAFRNQYPQQLPLPHLYPSEEGGIQAEWGLSPYDVTLEIDLARHTASWNSLDVRTGREETRQLNLDMASDWSWIVAQIRRLGGGVG